MNKVQIAHKEDLRSTRNTPWVAHSFRRPNARVRLFCFPYAGGDALSIYRKWPEILPSSVEVCAVQIPGRGIRVAEAPITDLSQIVKPIGEALAGYFDRPFAFFGHSMGAMMGFELSRLLRKQCGVKPLHLFVSGRQAPQIPDRDPPTYNLPEPEFLQELQRINGTPKEVLEHPELMELILPILKGDFQLCQTHVYEEGPPLNCPITVFGGLKDEATREELEGWRQQTTDSFQLHMLPGDHFFIRAEQSTVLRIVATRLLKAISG